MSARRPARTSRVFSLVIHSPWTASTAWAAWQAAVAQGVRGVGARQRTVQRLVDAEFGDDEVARHTGQVEQQPLHMESALAGRREVGFDLVEVPVVGPPPHPPISETSPGHPRARTSAGENVSR